MFKNALEILTQVSSAPTLFVGFFNGITNNPGLDPCQVVNDFARDDQSNDRRNECGGSGNVSSLRAFSDGSRRTDTMLSAADRHIF